MAIKQTKNSVTFSLKQVGQRIKRTPKDVFDYWVSITPYKSGNARRRTRLDNNRTINANYPYAQRLDSGWSKKAPQGMSKPTDRLIRRLLKQRIRK